MVPYKARGYGAAMKAGGKYLFSPPIFIFWTQNLSYWHWNLKQRKSSVSESERVLIVHIAYFQTHFVPSFPTTPRHPSKFWRRVHCIFWACHSATTAMPNARLRFADLRRGKRLKVMVLDWLMGLELSLPSQQRLVIRLAGIDSGQKFHSSAVRLR